MKLYIAGPMRGLPEFNFPAFHEAAAFLRAAGCEVVNPAEHDLEMYPDLPSWPGYADGNIAICPQFDAAATLAWDLQQVAECDAVAVLPGWQNSSGANLEVSLARLLNKQLIDARTGQPWSETVFEEAERIVNGARRWNYGTPLLNHSRTAAMWSAYLGIPVNARDVCILNILQKCSRDRNAPIRDNEVDIAGYARNMELVGHE
jgi:nucleoside 2-deoxyribosyltransferase